MHILHTLDVSFKEPFVGIIADPVDARVSSPGSPHQPTVLGVGPLPLPGYSSRGHRHADFVSSPSPPRQRGRSRRRNPFCSLQFGCCKGSLHINTVAAWGKRLEVFYEHCHSFLAQMGSLVSRHQSINGGPLAALTGRLRAQ